MKKLSKYQLTSKLKKLGFKVISLKSDTIVKLRKEVPGNVIPDKGYIVRAARLIDFMAREDGVIELWHSWQYNYLNPNDGTLSSPRSYSKLILL